MYTYEIEMEYQSTGLAHPTVRQTVKGRGPHNGQV